MAKSYKQYYDEYMKNVNTSAYDKLASNYAKSVDQQTAQQVKQANAAADSQLKQAYITRMQDQLALRNNMAAAGIRGGATETSNIKLATNYSNARGTINAQRASSINEINRTAAQNKLAYQQDIDAKKQAYIENRQSEARQAAREDIANDYNKQVQAEQRAYERRQQADQTAYERRYNENQRNYERQQTQRSQRLEEYTATFSKYYDVDKLKKLLTNPNYKNNPLAVQVINARIGYLTSPEYKAAKKAAK